MPSSVAFIKGVEDCGLRRLTRRCQAVMYVVGGVRAKPAVPVIRVPQLALRHAGMEPTVLRDVTGNAIFETRLTKRLAELGGPPPAGFVPVIRPPNP